MASQVLRFIEEENGPLAGLVVLDGPIRESQTKLFFGPILIGQTNVIEHGLEHVLAGGKMPMGNERTRVLFTDLLQQTKAHGRLAGAGLADQKSQAFVGLNRFQNLRRRLIVGSSRVI